MPQKTPDRPARFLSDRPELPLAALVFVVVVGGWEAAVRVFDIPAIVVPAPSAVIRALWEGLRFGGLPQRCRGDAL